MLKDIQFSLKNSFKGALSHINPVKAVTELDIKDARKHISEESHNIWQLLFHAVFWQDMFIENIKGNDPKWDDEGSWPTEEHMQNDENFEKLKNRFKEGVEELEKLMETLDLEEKLPNNRDIPRLQLFTVTITHNSYHVGQIVFLKKILNEQHSG